MKNKVESVTPGVDNLQKQDSSQRKKRLFLNSKNRLLSGLTIRELGNIGS